MASRAIASIASIEREGLDQACENVHLVVVLTGDLGASEQRASSGCSIAARWRDSRLHVRECGAQLARAREERLHVGRVRRQNLGHGAVSESCFPLFAVDLVRRLERDERNGRVLIHVELHVPRESVEWGLTRRAPLEMGA